MQVKVNAARFYDKYFRWCVYLSCTRLIRQVSWIAIWTDIIAFCDWIFAKLHKPVEILCWLQLVITIDLMVHVGLPANEFSQTATRDNWQPFPVLFSFLETRIRPLVCFRGVWTTAIRALLCGKFASILISQPKVRLLRCAWRFAVFERCVCEKREGTRLGRIQINEPCQ